MEAAERGGYPEVARLSTEASDVRGRLLAALKRDRFTAPLTEDELELIVKKMEQIKLSGTLLQEGEAAVKAFVIQEGFLTVSAHGRPLAVLRAGDCVGTAGVLRRSNAHSVATQPGEYAVVWSVDVAEISRLLDQWATKYMAENQKFIDRVGLFDFLPGNQKARLAQLPVRTQVLQAGDRVSIEGDVVCFIFLLQTGRLSGVLNSDHDTARRMAKYLAGDVVCSGTCIPQFRQNPLRWHTVADTDCKLLTLDFQTLLQMFGDDADECVQRAFMVFGLNQVPFMAGFAARQKQLLAKAMEVRSYQPHQLISEDIQFALVFDGMMLVQRGTATEELIHGDRYIDSTLFSSQDEAERLEGFATEDLETSEEAVVRLLAGPKGLTMAVLAATRARQAFEELGVSPVASAEDTTDVALEVLQARRVSVLRHLTGTQIERLVKQLVPCIYKQGKTIFEQGEIGTAFYIVASGQVQVIIDGHRVRTLARHGHFGERALLFEDHCRTATVRVVSTEAELWCLEKTAFVEVLTDSLRQEIMRRIEIQDSCVELQELTPVRVIGVGGFGRVRLVEHCHTGLRYALKEVRKVDGKVPEHVRGECELLAEMDHPLILDMLHTYETQTSLYILMEYITGGTLRRYIKGQGPAQREAARFYAGSLILVLEVLHDRNIVYRDLKPDNVMLDSQGSVKLIDFGLAKRLDEGGRTFTCVGSPHYMAPEAILSRREGYGTEVDVWALGVLLFELVCGCRPFEGREKQDIFEAVLKQALEFPAAYGDACGRDLLQGMLEKTPEARLGAGVFGWDDIKEHEYFAYSGNLFDGIVERSVRPPFVPAECHSDAVPQDLEVKDFRKEKTLVRKRTLLRRATTFAAFCR